MPEGLPPIAMPAGVEKNRPYKRATLETSGLDPARFATCSQPVKGQNLGCWNWANCKVRQRPEYKTAPDPRCFGITLLKKSPSDGKIKAVNMITDCINIPTLTAQAVLNGGGYRIVAEEGQKIRLRYSEQQPPPPGSVLPKTVKGIKEFEVPKYNDYSESLLADEITVSALAAFEEEAEETKIADLKRAARANAKS